MRRVLILSLLSIAFVNIGCRRYNAGDFPLKAGMTVDDLADKMGSPSRSAPHWVGYNLKDGTELRVYFLEGPKGSNRTLTEAAIYNDKGMMLKQVFKLPKEKPATQPTTSPTTQGVRT